MMRKTLHNRNICSLWRLLLLASSLLLSKTNAFVSLDVSKNFPILGSVHGHIRSAASASSVRRSMALEPSLPNFCADCGNPDMVLTMPDGDERLRACCDKCGRIEYQNPKVVVACVVRTKDEDDDKNDSRILLAKRAIEPRKGTWGIPQGYMEHGETTRQAAVREVYEETGAIIDPSTLEFRAVYNVPGSVQLVYEARVEASKTQQEIDAYDDNHESLEVALLDEKALAEKELCFPTVQWALDHCRSLLLLVECGATTSSAAGASTPIQQMTKFYDADEDVWNQFEDEPLIAR